MDKFHFTINGNIYTCTKCIWEEDKVIIIGSERTKDQKINSTGLLYFKDIKMLCIETSLGENSLTLEKQLTEDLNTVHQEDISIWYGSSNGLKYISIKTSSDKEYISPYYGGDVKPAK